MAKRLYQRPSAWHPQTCGVLHSTENSLHNASPILVDIGWAISNDVCADTWTTAM
jgi:hypothetical protein